MTDAATNNTDINFWDTLTPEAWDKIVNKFVVAGGALRVWER